jgi:hypothetical protein
MNTKALALGAIGLGAAAFAAYHFAQFGGGVGAGKLDLLAYVPNDSPYVVATLAPLPSAARERLRSYLMPMREVWKDAVAQSVAAYPAEGLSSAAREVLGRDASGASFEAMAQLFNIFVDEKAATAAGFPAQFNGVLYGIGAVPVVRIELADQALAQKTITKILSDLIAASAKSEQSKNAALSVQTSALGPDNSAGNTQAVMIFENNQLLVGALPSKDFEQHLKLLAPASASGGKVIHAKFSELKKLGYSDYMQGYVDTKLMLERSLGERTAYEQAIFPAKETRPPLSSGCKAELASIASTMPRISFGSQRFDGKAMESKMMLELAPGIASEYQSIVTPIPGYGAGKVAYFALALDTMKAMNVVRTQAQRVLAKPYVCEQFAHLNESAKSAVDALAAPALGMASTVKGFAIAVENMSIESAGATPKDVESSFAIFSDQPAALVAMLKNFVPGLEKLQLKDDSSVQSMDVSVLPRNEMLSKPEAAAAMSKNMIIVSGGANAAGRIKDAFKQPTRPQGTILELSYGQALMQQFSKMQAEITADASAPEAARMQKMQAVSQQMLAQLNAINFSINVRTGGVEVLSTTEFK